MTLMYLEDYLELVSFLPQEFKDRFTKVRELDLEASNRRDNIEKLKGQLRRPSGRDGQSDTASLAPDKAGLASEINSEYDKVVQLGLDKVKIVSGLEEMLLRYNRRLTADTEKFKLELEADNPGITEALETRAELEMKAHRESTSGKVSSDIARLQSVRRIAESNLSRKHQHLMSNGPGRPSLNRPPGTPDFSQSSRKMGMSSSGVGGAGMLARAASQAIAATQQMAHGRRTASMKASYEAALKHSASRDHSTDRLDTPKIDHRKRISRKKGDAGSDANAGDGGDEDKVLYCFCKEPSHGFMVACDNADCPIEWFHGSCVGVQDSTVVEGQSWYCLPCTEKMAEKRRKKNLKSENIKSEPGLKVDKYVKKSRKMH